MLDGKHKLNRIDDNFEYYIEISSKNHIKNLLQMATCSVIDSSVYLVDISANKNMSRKSI